MGWFGSKKKEEAPEPPKAQTFDQMSKDEQKEMQDSIRKDQKTSTREMDRAIMKSEMEIKMARKKLEKMVKKKEDKSICRQYAQNLLMATKNKEKLLNNKAKIADVQFSIDDMFSQVKMGQAMGNVTGIIEKANKIMDPAQIGKVAASLQTNLAKVKLLFQEL